MKGLSNSSATDDVNNNNNNAVTNTPILVTLDQKFICFDVEQVLDAKQKLQIGRLEGNKRVAWRIRTNAPTRYIVNPNGGVLDDTCSSQSLTVELVGNRYNPHHKLVVQAIQILDSESPKSIWKSQRAKDHEFVQTINLELSTTLMNLEFTQQMSNDRAAQSSASLASLLDQSSTAGPDRINELESLYSMLKSDTEKIQSNVDKTVKLKEVLDSHLETRKQTIKNLTGKIEENENRINQLNSKIKGQEAALSEVQARNKMNENKDCSIM
uniref:Major sperm protein n=1 Tax=Panagrolaimus superbus TaxID=310955 RepID=A0A914Y4E5_9BILA